MPIYTYKCPQGHNFERTFSMDNYERVQSCTEHDSQAPLIITSAPQVRMAGTWFQPGYDVGAGEYFGSYRDRQNWMTANGKYEITPEECEKPLQALKDAREAKLDGVKL